MYKIYIDLDMKHMCCYWGCNQQNKKNKLQQNSADSFQDI